MALTSGTRLGPYEIRGPLGKGGMGEVYRARDTRLDRDVAIKVLPPVLARDPERLARFDREAKVLASLSNPNIATIYGLEESPEGKAIAMELVEGATLAPPATLAEALRLAVQIAEALEAAHEKGVTHRDLKPANIMVTGDGVVKVLDFGLAAVGPPPSSSGENAPTLATGMTQAGVVMGTAAYMAPEQAAGKQVDKRADVWSFGVVLFELLTGRRLFEGETVSHTLADVLRAPVDLSPLPPATPLAVRRLLERCLERDPKRRLRDIGEARIALSDPDTLAPAPRPIAPAVVASPARRPLVWAALALAAIAAVAGVWALARFRPAAASREVTRFTIPMPPGEVVTGGAPAITRDGRFVAYAARGADGVARLSVRALDRFESTAIAGSDGAQLPFISPDGRQVGFFAHGKLMVASREGGAPNAIADASYLPLGAAWGENNEIFYVPALNSGILRIAASGGKPQRLTEPDEGAKGYAHVWPQYLFDTHSLLYTVWGGLGALTYKTVLVSPRDGKSAELAEGNGWSSRYAASGHIVRSGTRDLTAAPFDPARPREPAARTPVVEDVFTSPNSNLSWFSMSDTGTLVYVPGDPSLCTLAWAGRGGAVAPISRKPQRVDDIALSPDGTRAAFGLDFAVWMQDLQRGTSIRLTREDEAYSRFPVWSRDGARVLFASNRAGDWDLYTVSANGGPSKRLLARPGTQMPLSEAPDGTILFIERNKSVAGDLWTLAPDGKAAPLIVSAPSKLGARYSPDGRMIAYVSDETGREEVYLRLVAKPEEALAISAEGGAEVAWSADGRELFYRRGEDFYAVKVTPGTLSAGRPEKLFETAAARGNSANSVGYGVAPDGRFLIRQPDPRAIPTRINVVLNWFEELKAKVPVR